MIGYVQAGTLGEWQQRLGNYAKRRPGRLRIVAGGDWKDYKCVLPSSSITEHKHPRFPKVSIIHMLLRFC
jgi:hypothetical protein